MIVKEERKIITVVFPDGRDGRTFTLKVGRVPHFVSWLLLWCFKWEGWHLRVGNDVTAPVISGAIGVAMGFEVAMLAVTVIGTGRTTIVNMAHGIF